MSTVRPWRAQAEEAPHAPEVVQVPPALAAGEKDRADQEADPDPEHDREPGHGPVRDRHRVEDEDDQRRRDDEVEQPVGHDGAHDRRPGTGTVAHPPREDDHARELADPAG